MAKPHLPLRRARSTRMEPCWACDEPLPFANLTPVAALRTLLAPARFQPSQHGGQSGGLAALQIAQSGFAHRTRPLPDDVEQKQTRLKCVDLTNGIQGCLTSLGVSRLAKKARQRRQSVTKMQRAQGLYGFPADCRIGVGKRAPHDIEAAPVRGATRSGSGGSPYQGCRMGR